jgi:hypothetical protein
MRLARPNVRNGKVIQQTLVNNNEAIPKAANASTAPNDHDLLDNIAFTRGAPPPYARRFLPRR